MFQKPVLSWFIPFLFFLFLQSVPVLAQPKPPTGTVSSSGLGAPPVPGRPDNLTQALVDQLLANGQMNFDGMRFDNKRLDYINFAKGSFRGTTFHNCILNDGVSRRKLPEPEKFDFEETNVYLSKLNRVSLTNWKILRSVFLADSLSNGTFKNCAITDSKFYNTTVHRMNFNNGLKSTFTNAQFYSCTFTGGRFDSLRCIGGVFTGETKFTGVVFNETEFFNANFFKTGSLKGVLFNGGCRFAKVKVTSSNLDGVSFGEAVMPMWLEGSTFNNTTWRNGTANISFNFGCAFIGAAASIQNVDFTSSTFNGMTFGVPNAPVKLPIKQCKFTQCSFVGTATFYNCNLENSTFPPVATLQAAGVRFIGCTNAPYNSPGP